MTLTQKIARPRVKARTIVRYARRSSARRADPLHPPCGRAIVCVCVQFASICNQRSRRCKPSPCACRTTTSSGSSGSTWPAPAIPATASGRSSPPVAVSREGMADYVACVSMLRDFLRPFQSALQTAERRHGIHSEVVAAIAQSLPEIMAETIAFPAASRREGGESGARRSREQISRRGRCACHPPVAHVDHAIHPCV